MPNVCVCSVVFWIGDLNYRIDIDSDECKRMITKGLPGLEQLLKHSDQVYDVFCFNPRTILALVEKVDSALRRFCRGKTGVRIFSANCLIHLIAFITCCHPLVTLKSRLGLEKQPHILDPVTILTAQIFCSSCPHKAYITLLGSSFFHRIALHFIFLVFCALIAHKISRI